MSTQTPEAVRVLRPPAYGVRDRLRGFAAAVNTDVDAASAYPDRAGVQVIARPTGDQSRLDELYEWARAYDLAITASVLNKDGLLNYRFYPEEQL